MNKHAIDAVSLTFGSIFLGIVAWWLLARSVDIDLPRAGWFIAGGLILLGLVGLVVAARPGRGESA